MSPSNGRPEPEVIVSFADGFSYSKGKLEDAFRSGGILEKAPAKPPKETLGGKREDVDIIVNEFEITRPQAEKVLAAHGGDVSAALRALITPPSSTKA
jgi:NACalpha-BTF3-like transcription factor